ncbi:MAG: hypothetical protein WCR70_06105, partial [Sphaerochaetaceae bacterium]
QHGRMRPFCLSYTFGEFTMFADIALQAHSTIFVQEPNFSSTLACDEWAGEERMRQDFYIIKRRLKAGDFI